MAAIPTRQLAVLLLVVSGLLCRPAAGTAATPVDRWGGIATFPSNHTVGTSTYAGGTWSYTDRWGDNTGANTDGLHRQDYFGSVPGVGQDFTYDFFGVHRYANNGDYFLPSDNTRTPVLTADIIFFQMRQTAAGLDVRVVMNSLAAPDATIITLGIDSDGNHGGSTPFPHNAALGCSACGIDRFVTVWGTGGDVQDGRGHSLGVPTGVVGDTTDHAIDFILPQALMGTVASTWRLWLASGVYDGAGGYSGFSSVGIGQQATGRPRTSTDTTTGVFDLAFSPDDRNTVDDRAQADILASGDVTAARASVDMQALGAGLFQRDGMPTGGPVEQVFLSSLDLGQGTDNGSSAATFQVPEPGSVYHYLGRIQPYLVYLPDGYDGRTPLPAVISLHGYNGYYDEVYFELQSFPTPPANDLLGPELSRHNMIGIFPLGRGDIQYNRDAEKDILEVIADTETHYAVDPGRLHLTGLSMGGAGTWQLGEHHPDLFADLAPQVPNTAADVVNQEVVAAQGLGVPLPPVSALSPQGGIADEDALSNLGNTPTFVITAAGDFDLGGAVATRYYQDLRDMGAEAHLKNFLRQPHGYPVYRLSIDELFAFWETHALNPRPARVSYVMHTDWTHPQFGLIDDGAFWVDDMHAVNADLQGNAIARLDAEALTLPANVTSTTEATSSGGSAADGSIYTRSDAVPKAVKPRPRTNALSLTLANLDAATINLSGLGVDTLHPYCIDAMSQLPATLRLTGAAWSDVVVAGAAATVSGGDVLVTLPSGQTHAVVANRGVRTDVAGPCPLLDAGRPPATTPGASAATPTSLTNTSPTDVSASHLAVPLAVVGTAVAVARRGRRHGRSSSTGGTAVRRGSASE